MAQATMQSITEFFSGGSSVYLLAAAALYLLWTVQSWYRLRQFDGPWLASLSYLWLLRAVTDNKLHISFPDLHKKYGQFAKAE